MKNKEMTRFGVPNCVSANALVRMIDGKISDEHFTDGTENFIRKIG